MPDWAIHIIVPLLALMIAGRKEDHKYILLLLPLAVIPDFDTFVEEHRALLHNVFIPLVLIGLGLLIRSKRSIFLIAAVYIGFHTILDLFGGGVVLFYPLYTKIAFIDVSLEMDKTNHLLWIFDYGFSNYGEGWRIARGYISDSIGTGSLILILIAGLWAYRCKLYEKVIK